MVFYFGSHINIGGGMVEAAKSIKRSGGNFIQIFLTQPGSKKTTPKSISELELFKRYLNKNHMKVVVHSSYQHNLARNWDSHSWWIKNIELELEYCHKIDAIGLVIHFGKKLDLSLAEAYNNMYTSLIYIHNKTKKYSSVKIFLETSTGQGTETCFKLEDLAHFYKKFSRNPNKEVKERIKLCIDTCHIFSAGYDIRTVHSVKMYLEAFEELIGLRYVKLIHFNDCKVDLGSMKDRHQNIGKGYIGKQGLLQFFKYFKKLGVPTVLETPNEGYKTEIKMLLSS